MLEAQHQHQVVYTLSFFVSFITKFKLSASFKQCQCNVLLITEKSSNYLRSAKNISNVEMMK